MFRSILAFLVLASSALVLGATTHAQQSKPSGSFGYFAFVETSSGADRLTILHPELCPTGPCATFSLNAPMAQSQNRVNFEMPTAPGIGIGFDNTSPFPVVLVPTHLPNVLGFGPTFVEIVDFRAAPTSPPATCSSAGLNLCLDGGSIPYEILTVPGSGFAYVAEDSSVTGSLVLHQIYFGNGSVPSLNARWVLPQSSTSYASRLEVDPITSRIVVPMLNGIATVDPTNPLGASILIAPAPVDAFGLAYEVGTNVRTDFFWILG